MAHDLTTSLASAVRPAERPASWLPAQPHAHHFAIVPFGSAFSLPVACALDILAEANRVAQANLFSWEIMPASAFLHAVQESPSSRPGAPGPSRSAIFLADMPLELDFRYVDREKFRKAVCQLPLAIACGPAVELFAACGVVEDKLVAASAATRAWLSEIYPSVRFASGAVHWEGRIGTSVGGAATGATVLDGIARLGFADLAAELAGRLLLPDHSPARRCSSSPKLRYGVRGAKISRAIAFMETNLEEPLPIDMVAAEVGSSVRQLERLFKTQLDTTPARFLKRLRLERAKELLSNTELSIVEVVCATGFENPTHFSKCFKHRFSAPPTVWRSARQQRAGDALAI